MGNNRRSKTWKFPCKEAMKIPPSATRGEHIKQCSKCQDLLKERKEIFGW